MHVHVCSFFQAPSHDQLGGPYGGYTCYRAERATCDVNQSAMEDGRIMGSASLNGAEDRQKTGVLCMCMCALSFRRHPTISSVIPMEDTRAMVPRRPPMM